LGICEDKRIIEIVAKPRLFRGKENVKSVVVKCQGRDYIEKN